MKHSEKTVARRVLYGIGLVAAQTRGYYAGIKRFLAERHPCWGLTFHAANFLNPISEGDLRVQLASGIDGIFARNDMNTKMRNMISAAGVRCVIIDPERPHPPHRDRLQIFFDEQALASCICDFISNRPSYVSVAFVKDHSNLPWSRTREKTIVRALGAIGVRCSVFSLPEDLDRILALPKHALLIGANDCTAYQLSQICLQRGVRIPQEIALLGIDNETILCSHATPSLSSVALDWESGGYLAAAKMDALLSGRRVASLYRYGLPHVVERLSTRASSPAGQMVNRADEIIRAHARAPLTVAALAHELRLSRRLLEIRYRQIKGVSVLEAIHAVRLDEVKKLLLNPANTIKDVVRECGFADPSLLRKLFRRTCGCPMTEWRKQAKVGCQGHGKKPNAP